MTEKQPTEWTTVVMFLILCLTVVVMTWLIVR